ncbi:MAG: hypothetical protein HUU21_27030 [Polyangiaceae bacterium]|nr:hypothetical protein [Polyangiaceae bacterium]NUQ77205.1 hypothetical protein [Polyangiaceae bacterium]
MPLSLSRRAFQGLSTLGAAAAFWLFPAVAAAEEDPSRAVTALIHDLEKMVEVQTSIGWKIDRYEIEEMMPDALLSVCRTTDETRAAAVTALDERLDAIGGPPEEAYRVSGGDYSAIRENLFVGRMRAVLEEALRRAPSECPFYLAPEPDFRGVQTDAYRFTLSVEGGGLFTLQHWGGTVFEIGGGGSGRLLLGRGLNQHWTILAGPELGMTAIFDQDATSTNFPLQFVGAVPVVVRRLSVTWHYDMEVAPLGFYTKEEGEVSFGLRGGFLIGVSTLRIRGIMPWAGVGIAVEYIFPTDARGGLTALKGGARVGFDWDFGSWSRM